MNIYKGSRCDEWGTPPELLEQIIHPNWNMFDVCASDENHKFPDYWKKSDNCLRRPWPIDRTCWMNPPFSSAKSFFEKAAKEAARGGQDCGHIQSLQPRYQNVAGGYFAPCFGRPLPEGSYKLRNGRWSVKERAFWKCNYLLQHGSSEVTKRAWMFVVFEAVKKAQDES